MTCDFNGEMVLPLPFTILTFVVSVGLVIARFMRNKTNFLVSIMAVTDIILKINWFFLMIFLGIYQAWVAFGLIFYCFMSTFLINFFIWRKLYYKYDFDKDPEFAKYMVKYPKTSKILIYLSFVFSLHIFRITYSKLFGKKIFSATFKDH